MILYLHLRHKPTTSLTKIDLSSLTFIFQNLLSFKPSIIIKYLTKIIRFYIVKPTQRTTESEIHESIETRKGKIS